MSKYIVKRLNSIEEVSLKAADFISSCINFNLERKNRVQIALSGGTTPAMTYKLLSESSLDWSRVDVVLGDERWVDQKSDLSNSLMLRKTLLSSSPGSEACFYPVPTTQLASPKESSIVFQNHLEEICVGTPPVFDLIVLGLGDDGHTASLFPYSDSLKVIDKWVTIGLGKGTERITLTSSVLNVAKKVVFLVAGESKKIALQRLIDPNESEERTPAKLVQPSSEVVIFADELSTLLI